MPALDNLRMAAIAPGGVEEAELGEPVGKLREAGTRTGAAVNANRFRTEPAMQSVLKQIIRAEKAMTVICHAPWGLVPSGPARGRIVASSHALQDDLRNAGATWVDREVIVHGNLVTSRQPGGIPAVTREMLNLFAAARAA